MATDAAGTLSTRLRLFLVVGCFRDPRSLNDAPHKYVEDLARHLVCGHEALAYEGLSGFNEIPNRCLQLAMSDQFCGPLWGIVGAFFRGRLAVVAQGHEPARQK